MAAKNARLDVDQADNLFGVPVCMRAHDLLVAGAVGMSRAALNPLSPKDVAISGLSSSPDTTFEKRVRVSDGAPAALKHLWTGPCE